MRKDYFVIMSLTNFNKNNFAISLPENILNRVRENMEVYHLILNDALKEAAQELAKKGTELWKAWYHDDFRAFIPSAYLAEYLDFTKYPLKYTIND